MHHKLDRSMWITLLLAALLSLVGNSVFAGPAAPPVVGTGELQSLSVLPEKVILLGADQVQQMVVTGHFANSGVRDLTAQIALRVADPAVVGVEPGGLLVARKNGSTEVTAEIEGK